MFRVKYMGNNNWFITNGVCFLHSDGEIFGTREYWPTEADAQAVLDKFYPKPPEHVWKHGDVFKTAGGSVMMYLHPEKKYGRRKPSVVYVSNDIYAYGDVDAYLIGAKFLFNIKDVIKEKI